MLWMHDALDEQKNHQGYDYVFSNSDTAGSLLSEE